jgi:NAD(P)-dependent dehydrogenase (short-subunit alcohol dehydrogenase family)
MARIPLKDSVVVVVGGSSGIGAAVARAALEEGARVVLGGRGAEGLEEARKRLGGDVRTFPIDITERDSIYRFFEQVGPLDHLVITAGDEIEGTIRDLDPDVLRRAMETRWWGPLHCVKAALPNMSPEGSVTLPSGASAVTRAEAPLWHALLGCVESLMRVLASEVGPIRVNAVRPGTLLTERTLRRQGGQEAAEKYVAGLAEKSILGRVGYPEDVAQGILFLMTNPFTTGHALAIDGGFTFMPRKAPPAAHLKSRSSQR